MKRAVLASATPAVRVSCKIRLGDSIATTIAFAQRLEAAGCGLLAVHCRRREDKHNGPPDLVAGRALVAALGIPVIINGGVCSRSAARRVLAATGAHGVMVAQALLSNPRCMAAGAVQQQQQEQQQGGALALVDSSARDSRISCGTHPGGSQDENGGITAGLRLGHTPASHAADVACEYLCFAEQHPPPTAAYIRKHLRWMLREQLQGPGQNEQQWPEQWQREEWRPKLWQYLSRGTLSSVWQFRQCILLFCLLSKDVGQKRTPASLQGLPTPTFKSIRFPKGKRGKKHKGAVYSQQHLF